MSQDEEMMLRALALSMKGRITAPPNPWVGCVIVKNKQIIGEGYHYSAGQPHAEINALNQAKEQAEGSTVYVTLEPCAHFGRTPPCSQALIKAKVARVVIGLLDPDPRVKGKGMLELHNAGIETIDGVAAQQIAAALAPYLHQRKTGRPYCIAKSAISIDGRVAAVDGSSKWISSEEARCDTHRLRAESQAILIGVGTANKDLPTLTVRNVEIMPINPPLRVILDSKGSLRPEGALFDTTLAPTLIITTKACNEQVIKAWQQKNVEVAILPEDKELGGVDLFHVLDLLGTRGILQVLVEGGSTLLGNFFKRGLIQHLSVYIGPRLLGNNGVPLYRNESIQTLEEAPLLKFKGTQTFGDTVRLDYEM